MSESEPSVPSLQDSPAWKPPVSLEESWKRDVSREGFLLESNWNLHGSEIRFLGVTHNLATLGNTWYRRVIEDSIKSSDFVCPEYVYFDEGRSLTNDPNRSIVRFFNEISDIAAREHKTVVRIDPETDILALADQIVKGTAMGVGLATVISNFRSAFRPTVDSEGKKNLSRRAFLRGVGLVSAGAAISYNDTISVLVRMLARGEEPVLNELATKGLDDTLIFDLLNYRNLTVADTLGNICKQSEPKGGRKITLVYGIAHQDPIRYYSLHPESVEQYVKQLPRAALDIMGASRPQAYNFDERVHQWVKAPLPV